MLLNGYRRDENSGSSFLTRLRLPNGKTSATGPFGRTVIFRIWPSRAWKLTVFWSRAPVRLTFLLKSSLLRSAMRRSSRAGDLTKSKEPVIHQTTRQLSKRQTTLKPFIFASDEFATLSALSVHGHRRCRG